MVEMKDCDCCNGIGWNIPLDELCDECNGSGKIKCNHTMRANNRWKDLYYGGLDGDWRFKL